MTNRIKRNPPLHDQPLNSAGESSAKYLWDKVLGDELGAWAAVLVAAICVAIIECLHEFGKVRPFPLLAAIAAIAVFVIVVFWVGPRIRKQAARLRLGIEGEKHVAEVLDELKLEGYHLINDIVEDGYNIDHVLIGPTGVYVIETKARSARNDRDKVQVAYDGERVLVDGHTPDRDPLKQVQAVADRVRDVLRAQTGLTPAIRPVVLIPNSYVQEPKGVPIWVLNPIRLLGYVHHEPSRLTEADASVLYHALAAHARTSSTT